MHQKYRRYSRNLLIQCFVPTCNNNSANCPSKIFAVVIEAIKRKWCNIVKAHYDPTRRMYCCEDHLNLGEDLDFLYYYKVLKVVPRLKRTAKLRYYVSRTQSLKVIRPEEEDEVPIKLLKKEVTNEAGPSTSTNYPKWEPQPETIMAQPHNSYEIDQSVEHADVVLEEEQTYYVLPSRPQAEPKEEPLMEVSDQQTYLVLQPPVNVQQPNVVGDVQQQIIVLQQQEMGMEPQMMNIPDPQPVENQAYYEMEAAPSGQNKQLMMQLQPYLDIQASLENKHLLMQSPAEFLVQSQSVLDSEMESLEQQPPNPNVAVVATHETDLYQALKRQIVLELQPQMATEYVVEQPTHLAGELKPHIAVEQHAQEFITAPSPLLLEVQPAKELKTVGINTEVPYPDITAIQEKFAKQVRLVDASTQYESEQPPRDVGGLAADASPVDGRPESMY